MCGDLTSCSFLKATAEQDSDDDDESEDLINVKVSTSDEKVKFTYVCFFTCMRSYTHTCIRSCIYIEPL